MFMRRSFASLAFVSGGLALLSVAYTRAAHAQPNEDGAVDNMKAAAPSDVPPVDVDTFRLPVDEDGNSLTLKSLQPRFDRFSWETFVALNWPVKLNGSASGEKIGTVRDNLSIWELWKEDYEIFLEQGARPSEWKLGRKYPTSRSRDCPSYFPRPFRDLFDLKQAELRKIGKPLAVLETSVEPFDTGPLIDQNGKYARFEILVNEEMFQYIVDHELYSKASQSRQTRHVIFPCGSKRGEKHEHQGSVMIKAAWKVLSPEEKAGGRFHTADCLLSTRADKLAKMHEQCEFVTLGLVGFHIVHKTYSRPQWVWSTFEHVDNCPTIGNEPERPSYSFYASRQYRGLLETNSPPRPPWHPTVTEPPERRSQIKRLLTVGRDAEVQNRAFQKLLAGSVWANYRLISTQWPSAPAGNASDRCDPQETARTDIIGLPAPQFLGNSTLESYLHCETANASSSCIECHANATTAAAKFSDFTYLLLRAK
jgi:hypothetical protein